MINGEIIYPLYIFDSNKTKGTGSSYYYHNVISESFDLSNYYDSEDPFDKDISFCSRLIPRFPYGKEID